MSDAQSKIEIWSIVEKFDNDVTVTSFLDRAAAVAHLAATQYGEEDEFEEMVHGDPSGEGIIEFGDDYVALRKTA